MAGPYRISVVIPTYRRCASVGRTLRGLACQTLSPTEYEVIVSIDGSEDGTREMVAQLSEPYGLRSIWQPNQGRAAACNAGIRAATGELVVLLDDDMAPVPEFLAAHESAHRAGASVGILGAAPIVLEPSSPPAVRYIGLKFNRHLENLARPDHRLKLRDFYSGNFSIRREIMLAVGSFDEAFKIYGNEDLELSLRLAKAGVRFVYNPAALARQHYTKDFETLARDNIAKGRTAVLLATEHPETFQDLKLSTYHQGSLRSRLLRAWLLALGRTWPGAPDSVSACMAWLERSQPAWFYYLCGPALDYFYWTGALSAFREDGERGRELARRTRSIGGLRL